MNQRAKSILEAIGIILIPAGVAQILLDMVGIDGFRRGALQALSVCATLSVVYREHLVRVPLLAWIGVVNILLFALVLLKARATADDQACRVSTMPASKLAADMVDLIQETETEMLFSGINFFVTFSNNREHIINRVKSGVSVRVVMINPYGRAAQAIAADIGVAVQKIRSESSETLLAIKEVMDSTAVASKEWTAGGVEVRLVDSEVHSRAYIFTSSAITNVALVPFMYGSDSTGMPALKFEGCERGAAKNYKAAFEKLWSRAEPLADVAARTPELDLLLK